MNSEICSHTLVHTQTVERVRESMPTVGEVVALAELFKVFGDPTRVKILSVLFRSELCVCDICELLDMNKSAISHQLRVLRQMKIVKNRKSGKEVFYSLDDEHIEKIFSMAKEHLSETK